MNSRQHNQFPRRPARLAHRSGMTQGFTMVEVVMCMAVFTMMTLMFAAVFPMTTRGSQYSSNYAQATMLAQHKMDQLRSAGYDKLDAADLQPLGLIDAVNANGSYDFTTVDNLVSSGAVQGYFPAGSTGTVTITDESVVAGANGVPSGTLAYVTVTIAWNGGGVSSGSTSLSAIISKDQQ